MLLATPVAHPFCPAKCHEIAHRHCLSLAGPRSCCTPSQVVVDGGNHISCSRTFWKGVGLWGSAHVTSRGCDQRAIEPCSCCVCTRAGLPCPEPEERAFSPLHPEWGLISPHVLGAVATRRSSKRCACPSLAPAPCLSPPRLCASAFLTPVLARHRSL